MNRIVTQLSDRHADGFWNSHDDWFLERDLIKSHLFNGSLRLTDLTHALKNGQTCEQITFNWNWHNGTPPGLHHLLERHRYQLRPLFNELLALDWQPRAHWRTQEPTAEWQEFSLAELIVRFPEFGELSGHPGDNVQLYRSDQRGNRVWSPFATVNPLPEAPKKWTVPHVVRALLCGQFSDLKCHGVYTDDYAYDAACNFRRGEIENATAFARRILESPSGWWTYQQPDDGRISICCHQFDSNSFKFELMKRFNPLRKTTDLVVPPPVAPGTPRAAAPVTSSAPVATGDITLTLNAAKKLVELRFTAKPDETVRAQLKAAHWRWYGAAACWYNKHTPENEAWARAFIAQQSSPAPRADFTEAPEAPATPPSAENVTAAVTEAITSRFGPSDKIIVATVGFAGGAPKTPTPPMPAWRQRRRQ